ncbi:MAG: hypothetical protein AAF360_05605 [Pseudomonadota bacterium]
MTTPENGAAPPEDPIETSSEDVRLTRPALERTDPHRNILRAFSQSDGRDPAPRPTAAAAAGRSAFSDDEVWGAFSGAVDAPTGPAGPAGANGRAESAESAGGWRPGPLWDTAAESVKAAYDVIGAQIKEGEEAASRLNGGHGGVGAKTVPKALNRLVQTYSDLGAVWMELLGAVLDREAKGASAAPAARAETGAGGVIAVEVTASSSVTARARLYREPAGALTALPLRCAGDPSKEIAAVSVATGGVLRVSVDPGQAPGDYHGVVLEDGADEPIGSITVKIPAAQNG